MDRSEATTPLTLIAEYQARPGNGNRVAEILSRHVPATREEPGCITFVAYRDPDDPDHFALYEQYVDEEALQAHRESAHFAENVTGLIVPLLEDRRWRRYREVSPPTTPE